MWLEAKIVSLYCRGGMVYSKHYEVWGVYSASCGVCIVKLRVCGTQVYSAEVCIVWGCEVMVCESDNQGSEGISRSLPLSASLLSHLHCQHCLCHCHRHRCSALWHRHRRKYFHHPLVTIITAISSLQCTDTTMSQMF